MLPFFSSVRFYPELTPAWTRPGSGSVFLQDVDWLRARLQDYEPSVELRRMSEALEDWLPLREELLKLVAETRVDGWPFQLFPAGWTERGQQAVDRLYELLGREVACHFPQRTASELRALAEQVEQAVSEPTLLTGRQVGFARRVLQDTEERWGVVGSAEREAVMSQRMADRPVLERARTELLRRLTPAVGWTGLWDLGEIVAPLDDGKKVPERLLEEVSACLIASPTELVGVGALRKADDLGRVARQWSSGLWRAGSDPISGLLGDLQAIGGVCAVGRSPWARALGVEAPRQVAKRLAQEMLTLCWDCFPEQSEPAALLEEVWGLLEWSGVPRPSRLELVRGTAQVSRGSVYARYYGISDLHQLSNEEQLDELCRDRAVGRGGTAEVSLGRLQEESRILEGCGLWFLWQELTPTVTPRLAASRILSEVLKVWGEPYLRKNQRWQRHRKLAHLWQRLLFFLSLLSSAELEETLAECLERAERNSEVRAMLDALRQATPPEPEQVLVGWCLV